VPVEGRQAGQERVLLLVPAGGPAVQPAAARAEPGELGGHRCPLDLQPFLLLGEAAAVGPVPLRRRDPGQATDQRRVVGQQPGTLDRGKPSPPGRRRGRVAHPLRALGHRGGLGGGLECRCRGSSRDAGTFGRLRDGGLRARQLRAGVVEGSLQARPCQRVRPGGRRQRGQVPGRRADDAAGGVHGGLGAARLLLGGLELAGQPGERRGGVVEGAGAGAHRFARLLDVAAEGDARRPDPAPPATCRLGRGAQVGGGAVHGGRGRRQPPGRGAQGLGVARRDGDPVLWCGNRHRSYLPAGMTPASTAV
jgi:hypothetical protein